MVGPVADFFQRHGAEHGTARLHRLLPISDLILGVMANPFYMDLGYSLSQIAAVAKVFGFALTLAGARWAA